MSAVLADTHAVVWYLGTPGKLTAAATAALDGATQAGAPIYVASISVIEVLYLVEKGRLLPLALARLLNALDDPHSGLVPVTLDLAIVQAMPRIAYTAVPEMPDRIIAATALYLGVPLVTRDLRIRASGITTIWS
ncbi:MAG: type II toxin-antitoxin system VapC family toxin [Chloroflexaceae bacterium]|jgi:PIN domain nuclease of toxin-antitoxin system|nr:type II toxin-antitoxin system VapC family toxin [Chloroflexaceae bacterium]